MRLAGLNWSLQILSQLGEDKMLLAVVNYVERRRAIENRLTGPQN
jgi:hypothetical protein